MFISHCCFQPLTQPYDPWLLLCDSLLKNRAANIPFWKWCKVKSWGLYRNRLQRPENGAGEAMQPLKIGFSKKKSTILPTKYSAFWWRIPGSNRWPLACHASALPAELIPHNFPEVEASGKEMLKQEMLYEVQLWGCVSALLGLPAELIPHKFQKQASGMENL